MSQQIKPRYEPSQWPLWLLAAAIVGLIIAVMVFL
jgi:hypothetical protein